MALGDYDGDGRCDVYLCNLDGRNALFRNKGGWKFEDVTDDEMRLIDAKYDDRARALQEKARELVEAK